VPFENHLFISYAHLDNQPLTPEQQGWVTRFHASLEAVLSMRMGRQAEIWRDKKLTGNDVFADAIVAQFRKTALFISVLTPRYVDSDWCTREIREFCRVAEESGDLAVENKARVFKVIKTPIDSEELLPTVVRAVLGYQFYLFDDDRTPLELDPAYGPTVAQQYNLKIAKLAWDIAQQLKKLEAGVPQTDAKDTDRPPRPTVYLAECSWDQREAREALEAELRLHGYQVLPDRPLPRDEAGYVAEVARLLEASRLSVHLVGTSYGAVPDGPTQKSIVVLQNEIAAAHSKRAQLRRIIWLPEGTRSSHADQQRFIDTLAGVLPALELTASAEAQFGGDVITADLETLKSTVHSVLSALLQAKVSSTAATGGDQRLVYLICDERDRKATVPIRRYLKSRGLDVQIPIFEGDATTVRRENQDLLTRCDAIVVYYGAGDQSWKRAIDAELRKIRGYRGDAPLRALHTYLAEPSTGDKTDLIDMDEPGVINGLDGFSEQQLEQLVTLLLES
jgi:TIR domain